MAKALRFQRLKPLRSWPSFTLQKYNFIYLKLSVTIVIRSYCGARRWQIVEGFFRVQLYGAEQANLLQTRLIALWEGQDLIRSVVKALS